MLLNQELEAIQIKETLGNVVLTPTNEQ